MQIEMPRTRSLQADCVCVPLPRGDGPPVHAFGVRLGGGCHQGVQKDLVWVAGRPILALRAGVQSQCPPSWSERPCGRALSWELLYEGERDAAVATELYLPAGLRSFYADAPP